MASLWLVPAPLDFGVDANAPLGDLLPLVTLRQAAQISHWVVENAKTARAFLKRVDTASPLVTPIQQQQIVELPRPPKGGGAVQVDFRPLLAPLRAGHELGLLSEAGLPAVADPGALLVAQAHREGLPVRSLAGSSSLVQALAASGLNGQCFAFQGYLPQDAAARALRIRELEAQSRRQGQTQLVIETPYRNQALLRALIVTLQPGTQLAVSLSLTTAQERTLSKPVAQWRAGVPDLPKDQPAIFSWLAS
ncbi:SAM-dependent methyltransferase [Inhella sp.]|uniref:SAM-dependent methyltransferase n=1 Tax=Inhella sp. TaxID=1921806 RepID=UPI0035B456A0